MVKGFFAPKRQKFFEKIEIFLLLLAQVPVTNAKKIRTIDTVRLGLYF